MFACLSEFFFVIFNLIVYFTQTMLHIDFDVIRLHFFLFCFIFMARKHKLQDFFLSVHVSSNVRSSGFQKWVRVEIFTKRLPIHYRVVSSLI